MTNLSEQSHLKLDVCASAVQGGRKQNKLVAGDGAAGVAAAEGQPLLQFHDAL